MANTRRFTAMILMPSKRLRFRAALTAAPCDVGIAMENRFSVCQRKAKL